MSKKLIVINIGGTEFMGEEPQKWPPEKGSSFTLKATMILQHEVVGTPQGPARVFFLHPVGDYEIKTFNASRPVMDKERKSYTDEQEASRMVKTIPRMSPEELERLAKLAELAKGDGQLTPPPGSAILAAR